MLIGLLETDGSSFLQRADTAVADASMGSANVLDKVLRTNKPPDTPSCAVKILASRTNGESQVGNLGGKSSHASKRSVVKTVVDLVAQDDDVVLNAEIANGLQLFLGKHLADWVMRAIEYNHTGLVVDGSLELVHVKGPFTCRGLLAGALLRRVQGHVDDLAAGHLNVVDVLVEERLEDNDLVTGLDKAHEGREHSLVCAGRDCHLFLRIQSAAKEGRVRVGQSFLQARSSLGRRVLVAFDPVQSTFGGIDDELRRIVAKEALSAPSIS